MKERTDRAYILKETILWTKLYKEKRMRGHTHKQIWPLPWSICDQLRQVQFQHPLTWHDPPVMPVTASIFIKASVTVGRDSPKDAVARAKSSA